MAIYAAKEAFTFDQDGAPRVFTPGDLISDDDPGYKGRERLFEPVSVVAARRSGVTETASAAPGEVRHRGRGRQRVTEDKTEENSVDKAEGENADA